MRPRALIHWRVFLACGCGESSVGGEKRVYQYGHVSVCDMEER